jgi:hypothetical protein
MRPLDRIADRALGSLGLFIIGAISWAADRLTAAGRPAPETPARGANGRSGSRRRPLQPGTRLTVPERARS